MNSEEIIKLEELLKNVIDLLKKSEEERVKMEEQYTALLVRSEERIAKTNEMISSLSNAVHENAKATQNIVDLSKNLNTIYNQHIKNVVKARDAFAENLKSVVDIVNRQKQDNDLERKRNEELMQDLLTFAKDMARKNSTSINVK